LRKFNIAIDGYSSCGKSTLAKQLAQTLHFVYVDSGAMYRAVTLYALRHGLIQNKVIDSNGIADALDDIDISFIYNRTTGQSETILNGENIEQYIRTMEVSGLVSPVSAIPAVRVKLQALQRGFGKSKGVVMDGRDIGTVIFPNAQLKLFMTASNAVRSQRRYEELKANGQDVSLEEVLENLISRDQQDTTRAESPLRKAEDAIVIDNSELTEQDQLEIALSHSIRVMAEEKRERIATASN